MVSYVTRGYGPLTDLRHFPRTKTADKKVMTGKIPITDIIQTWSLDYTEKRQKTNRGHMYCLVGVEHNSKWPLLRARSGTKFNVRGTINFVEEYVIKPFGPPQNISSDNDLNFDWISLHDFEKKYRLYKKIAVSKN